jgi:hypothetical protein
MKHQHRLFVGLALLLLSLFISYRLIVRTPHDLVIVAYVILTCGIICFAGLMFLISFFGKLLKNRARKLQDERVWFYTPKD